MSDSLRPLGLQCIRLPCPSLSPGVCSDSYPLSWCCSLIILCQPLLLLPSIFPSIGVFSNESSFFKSGGQSIGAPSFSINPSNDYSGLISFRIDWFDLLAVSLRDFEESSPTRQFKSINSLVLSFFYGPTLTSVHIIYIYVILLIYSGCAWPSLLCRLFSSCSKQELPST